MLDLLRDVLIHYIFPTLSDDRKSIQSCAQVNKNWRSAIRNYLTSNKDLIYKLNLICIEDIPLDKKKYFDHHLHYLLMQYLSKCRDIIYNAYRTDSIPWSRKYFPLISHGFDPVTSYNIWIEDNTLILSVTINFKNITVGDPEDDYPSHSRSFMVCEYAYRVPLNRKTLVISVENIYRDPAFPKAALKKFCADMNKYLDPHILKTLRTFSRSKRIRWQ